MGDVSFMKNKSTNMGLALAGASAIVPTDSGMILFTASGVVKNTVAHELAHVWDINSGKEACAATWCGGGHADALAEYLGGEPGGIRWNNGTSGIPVNNSWDTTLSGRGYGNNSTADYFAEAFSWSIYDLAAVPQVAFLWIQTIISLEGR